MSEKIYNFEERTLTFARKVRDFCKVLPRSTHNREYIKQIIRSSASVGANYREANEALGKKDFLMRLKIAKKEANESKYWLQLVDVSVAQEEKAAELAQEAQELINILGAMLRNSR